MHSPDRTIPRFPLTISIVAVLLAASAHASPLAITETPLTTTSSVKSNIMLIIDDSGSMDSEVLLPTNDGALWWNTSSQSFVGLDSKDNPVSNATMNYNQAGTANGTWKKYVYLFPNGTATGARVYSDASHDHYAVPPTRQFAFLRSADYNGMYYDHTVTYTPWVASSSASFTDAPPTAAPSEPTRGTQTLNLSVVRESTAANEVFRFHSGMIIPAGTRYSTGGAGAWTTAASDVAITGNSNIAVSYLPATYFVPIDTGTYTVTVSGLTVAGSCASPNPLHFGGLSSNPSSFTSSQADALAPDGRCLKRYEIRSGNSFPSGRTYTAELQNFANWFTYYRKRNLALRAGAGQALRFESGTSFRPIENVRVGGFTINDRTLKGMWDIDTERSSVLSFLYSAVGSGGTPNRIALDYAGRQFNTNTNVIQLSCQKNFALLFTDGFSNPDNTGVGNADGSAGAPYADSHSETIADIAMHYFNTRLRTDLTAGNVPVPTGCNAPTPSRLLNCNKNLHMVTFGITLGAEGEIFGKTHFSVADAHKTPPAWANPNLTRHPVQVDDLYHAAVNGRGEMLNAARATDLQVTLSKALTNIASQTVGATAAATANTGFIGTNSKLYQARFNTAKWSGELLAYALDTDFLSAGYGLPKTPEIWEAGAMITNPSARKIYTRSSGASPTGIPFKWANLSASQQTALGTESVLNYLRGERTGEATGAFRSRSSVLGDILNSAPAFVGAPNLNYSDDLEAVKYSKFRNDNAGRKHTIYLGANDGMLHGFDADNGAEVMAYVPSLLFGKLKDLSSPTYTHRYYVDGSPSVIDAFDNRTGIKAWKTVLVSGLNRGGQGLFALDVTDPSLFANETNASKIVLWEFSHTNDADLGYTYSQPSIAKLANGRWAAIFGNGYNNTEADGSASTSGNAVLFIVDLFTGALIEKLDTGVGRAEDPRGANRPNGLATAVAIDTDGDFLVDAVYAGDLFGNLWKFDLSGTNSNQWGVAYKSGGKAAPLFKACSASPCTTGAGSNAQPITTAPSIGKHPTGKGVLVFFGTGKFLETADNTYGSGGTQSFYAIWDDGSPVARTKLLQQSITNEILAGATGNPSQRDIRVTSTNAIDWKTHQGWYLNLVSPTLGSQGERVIANPVLRNNRIIFVTSIPNSDPCAAGGQSWLMEMKSDSGARLTYSPFDLNHDRKFSEADYVTITVAGETIKVPVSGIRLAGGNAATPNIMGTEDGETKCISSLAGLECIRENPGPREAGRQGWRQLIAQ